MSKIIKLTEKVKGVILEDFFNYINSTKLSTGEIQYKKTIPSVDRKASLCFTPKAWGKMLSLIRCFEKEVGWHGLVKRGDDETKDEYIVYDILLYPQTVTAATVTTDQSKYTQWLYSQSDEDFKAMKFHGHSHVRMGVTPSPTDKDHQTGILDQLTDDMFYVFTIWNKSLDLNAKIYDLKKNILFETLDVEIKLIDDECDFDEFVKDAKTYVQENTPQYNSSYNSQYSGNYSGSYNSNASKKDEKKDDTKPSFGGVKTVSDSKEKSGSDTKKDKQPLKRKGTVVPVNSYYGGGYDDYDDMYSYYD